MADNVIFHNQGAFSCSFSVQWNGGESGRTEVVASGGTTTLDLKRLNIPPNTSCWARAYVMGGKNHDSGGNFTFARGTGTVAYTVSGTSLNPSFDGPNSAGEAATKQGMLKGGSAADVDTASKVRFINSGGFECNFSVQWNGGETNRTAETWNGGEVVIDLNLYNDIPDGTSCWARAYIVTGPNHDSGRNFTYSKSSPDTVQYTISGSTADPNFN